METSSELAHQPASTATQEALSLNRSLPSAPGRTRDFREDLLKAAAIFGVVFIHTPGGSGDLRVFFRFCVPIFVALWAFHFEIGWAKRSPAERRPYIRSRIIRLTIPFLFWTAVYLLLFRHSLDAWRMTSLHTIIGAWFGGYLWSGQYFLIILFQLIVVVTLLHRLIGPASVWATLLAGLVLYAVVEFWLWQIPLVSALGDRLFIYWLPYVALGIGLARGYFPSLPGLVFAVLGVVVLALGPAEFRWARHYSSTGSDYLLLSVYLGAMALTAAATQRRDLPRKDRVTAGQAFPAARADVLVWASSYLGRNTFPVFVINPLVVYLIPTAVVKWVRSGPLAELQHAALTAGVLGVCLLLGWLFRRTGLGILIGV